MTYSEIYLVKMVRRRGIGNQDYSGIKASLPAVKMN